MRQDTTKRAMSCGPMLRQCCAYCRMSEEVTVSNGTPYIAVTITPRNSSENSPVLQQVLNLLPFWLNVFNTPAENFVVYSLELFPRNFWNLAADILPERGNLFYTLYLSNSVTNQGTRGECGGHRPWLWDNQVTGSICCYPAVCRRLCAMLMW